MVLAVGIVRFIMVYIAATDIRITAVVITIITTTTIRISPTGRIDPTTGRSDRPLYLHTDREEAWVVPLQCREVVVAAVAGGVARFGLAHDIRWMWIIVRSWPKV